MQKNFASSFIVSFSLALATLFGAPPYVDLAYAQPADAAFAEHPDVPFGDPAYTDIIAIHPKAEDILPSHYGIKWRPRTRYDFAVALARIWDQSQRDASINQHIAQDSQTTEALRRLFIQFQPELKNLGVDQNIQNWLREIEATQPTRPQPLKTEPFSDVPRGHWAFAAVERLREEGIVAGYADGAYQRSIAK